MSNAVPFTVEESQLTSISPNRGGTGTAVTFTGTGFGAAQGSGVVWLGSTAGLVVSWSDTQVVATVGSSAVSGIARIQQNGVWSGHIDFTVPAPAGNGPINTLMPSLLNMSVGDTRTLQALGANGQTVTGLTWATTDPTIVSLSPDDPPLLTALAAGHVTITAGSGSTDVTVFAGPLPLGTVIWSNPGNGSGVTSIVPAVPSTTGVADVFAFQADGTVQAITSDGSTAWTADVSGANYWGPGGILPDFQGGLVALGDTAIWKLDGITGQPYPAYSPGGPAPSQCGNSNGRGPVALHPDGTIIAVQCPQHTAGSLSLVGIDPTTGGLKFSVPIPADPEVTYGVMIAGDGYAYFPYSYITNPETGPPFTRQLSVFRVNSSGASDNIPVFNWTSWSGDILSVEASMITNADQGILLTWGVPGSWPQMAITTGGVATIVDAPLVPGNAQVYPVLQAQDGSFVGTVRDYNTGDNDMIAFDAAGNVRWIVPNETPQIATADGGVTGKSGITYDQNGNATGQVPLLAGASPSWGSQVYTAGASGVNLNYYWLQYASSLGLMAGGNPSGNGTSIANLELTESNPMWWSSMKWTMPPVAPGCQLGDAQIKLGAEPLPADNQVGKAALGLYNAAQQAELTFLQQSGAAACGSYLANHLNVTFNSVVAAVKNQVPWDGILTTISLYNAGTWGQGMDTAFGGEFLSLLKQAPVCAMFWYNKSWNGTSAVAQAQPPVTSTSLYVEAAHASTVAWQVTILHESLHNLTGLGDNDLYKALGDGIHGLGNRPSAEINGLLNAQHCAGSTTQ